MLRPKKRPLLARLLLVLALLAGWQAALVHPVEHVDAAGRLVHVAGGHSSDKSSSDPAAKLCDALSALTAFAPQAANSPSFDASASPAPSSTVAVAKAAETVAYLSRGPPARL